jgi:hypothetical protein
MRNPRRDGASCPTRRICGVAGQSSPIYTSAREDPVPPPSAGPARFHRNENMMLKSLVAVASLFVVGSVLAEPPQKTETKDQPSATPAATHHKHSSKQTSATKTRKHAAPKHTAKHHTKPDHKTTATAPTSRI